MRRGQTIGEAILILSVVLAVIVFAALPILRDTELSIAISAARSAILAQPGVTLTQLDYETVNNIVTLKPKLSGTFSNETMKTAILAAIDCSIHTVGDTHACLANWRPADWRVYGRYVYQVEI